MQKEKLFRMRKQNKEGGFTLLEYCAGAAVLIIIVYGAFNAMGGEIRGFLNAIGGWAAARAEEVRGQN